MPSPGFGCVRAAFGSVRPSPSAALALPPGSPPASRSTYIARLAVVVWTGGGGGGIADGHGVPRGMLSYLIATRNADAHSLTQEINWWARDRRHNTGAVRRVTNSAAVAMLPAAKGPGHSGFSH